MNGFRCLCVSISQIIMLKSHRRTGTEQISVENCEHTVPLETISAFACGNTSALPIVFTAKSPRLDENRNRGKDESNRMPRPT